MKSRKSFVYYPLLSFCAIFLIFFIFSCAPYQTNIITQKTLPFIPKIISLNGNWKAKIGYLKPGNLYLPDIDDSNWKKIHVPSNWYLENIDYSGALWYRKDFMLDPSLKDKTLTLIFEGVDYYADVWVNGRYVGSHEGYFQPFYFNITSFVDFSKKNILAVRVMSPYEEIGKIWSLHKRLIKGIFNHHDTRPGGAWSIRGQDKNTGGIWNNVYLKISDKIFIRQIHVTPKILEQNKKAECDVKINLTSYGTKPLTISFVVRVKPKNFISSSSDFILKKVTKKIIPGKNSLRFKIKFEKPKLWWPWDLGFPHLYTLSIQAINNDKILDKNETTFGIREVRLSPKKIWYINNKRIFLRGTNYISSQWLSEMTKERFLYDLALMKRANINVIRVHAHIEPEKFYKLCDEIGILVWQDFSLQWGYIDNNEFIEEAKRQVRDMISMLYNHPSIIAWCGHNEPPWDAPWMKYKYPDYNPNQNKKLDEELYNLMKSLDKTRHIHKHSATVEHPWLGWYSGSWKDYAKPIRLPLITEFGAQALLSIDSLRKIFSEDELWPKDEKTWKKWEYHNFQRRENFKLAKIKMGRNIYEFIKNSQSYQANLIKFAAECYRRQQFKPVAAIFQFMFVEDWPSINWGIVDYFRNPKPGYFALKEAYQPLLPSIEWKKKIFSKGEKIRVSFWVINDLHKDFNIKYLIKLIKGDKLIEKIEFPLFIKRSSCKKIKNWESSNLDSGKYLIIAEIKNQKGKIISSNHFNFEIKEKALQ
ncbi:MAG: beta galactosidase jelly roll domain-containing protein [Deltaproteobacteria bacterium]|nr:beta galactosidase jelly roll domain-containing protein [Deltaproteobacteria bacterium]